MGAIADIALQNAAPQDSQSQLLDQLRCYVGFEVGSILFTPGPHHQLLAFCGWDEFPDFQQVQAYMAELEPGELLGFERLTVDTLVLSAERRDRIGLYREQLRPHGVAEALGCIWRERQGAFGIHLGRAGRGVRYRAADVRAMESILPMVRVAMSHIAKGCLWETPREDTFRQWADEMALSRGQRRVAELVTRGLRNDEIASLLGVSRLTVRNQLSAVLHKVGASNRTELAFLCSTEDRPTIAKSRELRPWVFFFRPKPEQRSRAPSARTAR